MSVVLYIGKHVARCQQAHDSSLFHTECVLAAKPLAEVAAFDFFGGQNECFHH